MINHELEGMVTILLDPTKYNLDLKKFEQYWEKTEIVVYILFQRVFGNPYKSETGLLGYPLSFVG